MTSKWRSFLPGGLFMWAGTMENGAWPILLPTIARDFDVSTATIAWILIAFALGMAGSALTVGHLGDVIGHKRLALVGFALEGVMLVLVVVSPSLWLIFGLRFVQGIGRATGLNNVTALTYSAFDAAERGKLIGRMSGLVALGLMMAPVYAGFVAEHTAWRMATLGVVALYVVQIVITALVAPDDRRAGVDVRGALRGMDWAGALSFLNAICGFLLAAQALRQEQTRLLGVGGIAAAALVFALALRFERRAARPVLNLGLFRSPAFSAAGAALMIFALATGATTFLFPFYMQRGLGFTLALSGLVLMAPNIVQLWASPLCGSLADKLGAMRVQATGVVVMVAALLWAANLGDAARAWQVAAALALFGAAGSLAMPANNKIIYAAVPRTAMGSASAVSAVGRYIGQSLGAAGAATLLSAHAADGVPAGFRAALLLLALIVGVGASGALLAPRLLRALRRPAAEAPRPEPADAAH